VPKGAKEALFFGRGVLKLAALQQFAEIQSQLQSETGRRGVQVAEQLAQLLEAVEHGVAVEV
jgi:hypothetical protein